MDRDLLDIVDDNDVVTGQATRKEVHLQGLLHRDVHIFFITPAREILFQRRVGGWTDATVGGHVDGGEAYDQAARREMCEETGIDPGPTGLLPLAKVGYTEIFGEDNKYKNTGFRMVYGYMYRAPVADIRIESGKGAGFAVIPVTSVIDKSAIPADIIPRIVEPDYMAIYQKLTGLLA